MRHPRVSRDWDRYLNPLSKSAVLHTLEGLVTNLPLSSYFWKFWLYLRQVDRRWGDRISISGFTNSSISFTKKFSSKIISPDFSFMPSLFAPNPCHFNGFFLFYCACCNLFLFHFSFPWKSQATAEANWKEQDSICQVCTITRNLHNDVLTASCPYALALLFPISLSGCCTNQILSKISEGFFFFFSAA